MTSAAYRSEAERWKAWEERDLGAISAFFIGVRSTGIYCRVGCPARGPKRENIRFFDTYEQAEAAGFRPCKRCQPRETPAQRRVVAQVLELLETAEPTPTLRQLAGAVGISPYHLQRLFKRETGLSPKQYAAAQRLRRLKEGLRQGQGVSAALYDAGYGSSAGLYATADTQLGMTPAVYRRGGKGMRIRYAFANNPIGKLLIGVTEKGICAVLIGDNEAQLLALLRQEFAQAELEPGVLAEYVKLVLENLSGQAPRLDLPLDLRGTAFQLKVWEALRRIPPGETRTYGELARDLGDPKAVRAVARACGANLVALVVPCHRVVGSGGKLTGYRWGVERKRRLLEQETLHKLEHAV
jgi:AraC family transcriptional regulator of adaptative response/methylated-DNA-[protein]-cysteine methyltransferase